MNCNWDGDRFSLEEIHRFSNGGVRFGTHLYWDVLRIWSEIQSGLKKFKFLRSDVPAGIGVDAWGVDYCLLDNRDRLLGNPYHYRDARTNGMPVALLSFMTSRAIFQATGGRRWKSTPPINSRAWCGTGTVWFWRHRAFS
jgi:rhamnulokinase